MIQLRALTREEDVSRGGILVVGELDPEVSTKLRELMGGLHTEWKTSWKQVLEGDYSETRLILGSDEAVRHQLQSETSFCIKCFGTEATLLMCREPERFFRWNGGPVCDFILDLQPHSVIPGGPKSKAGLMLQEHNAKVVESAMEGCVVVIDGPIDNNYRNFITWRSQVDSSRVQVRGRKYLDSLSNRVNLESLKKNGTLVASTFEGIRCWVAGKQKNSRNTIQRLLGGGAVVDFGICCHSLVVLTHKEQVLSFEEGTLIGKFKCFVVLEAWVNECIKCNKIVPVDDFATDPCVTLPLESAMISASIQLYLSEDVRHDLLTELKSVRAPIVEDLDKASVIVMGTPVVRGNLDYRMRTAQCIKTHLNGMQTHCPMWHYPVQQRSLVKLFGESRFSVCVNDSNLAEFLETIITSCGGEVVRCGNGCSLLCHVVDSPSAVECGTRKVITASDLLDKWRNSSDCYSTSEHSNTVKKRSVTGNYVYRESSPSITSLPAYSNVWGGDDALVAISLSQVMKPYLEQLRVRDNSYLLVKQCIEGNAINIQQHLISFETVGEKSNVGFAHFNQDSFQIASGIYVASDEGEAADFTKRLVTSVISVLDKIKIHNTKAIQDDDGVHVVFYSANNNPVKIFSLSTGLRYRNYEALRFGFPCDAIALLAHAFNAQNATLQIGRDVVYLCNDCQRHSPLPRLYLLTTGNSESISCFVCSRNMHPAECFVMKNEGLAKRRRSSVVDEVCVKDIILDACATLHPNLIQRKRMSSVSPGLLRKLQDSLHDSPFQSPSDGSLVYYDGELGQFRVTVFGEELYKCAYGICMRAFPLKKKFCAKHTII